MLQRCAYFILHMLFFFLLSHLNFCFIFIFLVQNFFFCSTSHLFLTLSFSCMSCRNKLCMTYITYLRLKGMTNKTGEINELEKEVEVCRGDKRRETEKKYSSMYKIQFGVIIDLGVMLTLASSQMQWRKSHTEQDHFPHIDLWCCRIFVLFSRCVVQTLSEWFLFLWWFAAMLLDCRVLYALFELIVLVSSLNFLLEIQFA